MTAEAPRTPLGKCLGHIDADGQVEWAEGTPPEGTLLYDRQWTEAEIAEGVRRGKIVWEAAHLAAATPASTPRCTETLSEEGSTYRCQKALGHDGLHENGDWEWHAAAQRDRQGQ